MLITAIAPSSGEDVVAGLGTPADTCGRNLYRTTSQDGASISRVLPNINPAAVDSPGAGDAFLCLLG